MAPAARRLVQGGGGPARRGLSPALDAEALGAAGGRRRGGLFLRQRPLIEVDRQHTQRRRRQRGGVCAMSGERESAAGERRLRGEAERRMKSIPCALTLMSFLL